MMVNTENIMRAYLLFPLFLIAIVVATGLLIIPLTICAIRKEAPMNDIWSSYYHGIIDLYDLLTSRRDLHPNDPVASLVVYYVDMGVILLGYAAIIFYFI